MIKMKKSAEGIVNQVLSAARIISEAVKADNKHEENARCKAGDWGGVACYLEFAFGIRWNEEELQKAGHLFK